MLYVLEVGNIQKVTIVKLFFLTRVKNKKP